MSPPNASAEGGGDGTTNEEREQPGFKNADVIGHPGATLFQPVHQPMGYSCAGAGTAFMPIC